MPTDFEIAVELLERSRVQLKWSNERTRKSLSNTIDLYLADLQGKGIIKGYAFQHVRWP